MKKHSIKLTFILFQLLFCADLHAQITSSDTAVNSNDTVVKGAVSPADSGIKGKVTAVHVYKMNYWVSIPICLVGTAGDIYAIPNVIKAKSDNTDAMLMGLNKNTLNGFDRWAVEQDLSQRDQYMKISDYTLPVIIASAGFLALDKKIRKDWLRILVMYYEMHTITFSLYNYSFFGPGFQDKFRPVAYYDQLSFDERRGGNFRNSMYSGHTATAIASTFFMVKVYSDYNPQIGNKKYLLYGLAMVPPLVEGYFRVKGLEHFPSDVMIGMGIGALCGILVPEVHRFKTHKIQVQVSGASDYVGFNLRYHLD